MRLLYIAITKGWPAALFYDQQGGDEFLDVSPDFWATFQPPQRPARPSNGQPLHENDLLHAGAGGSNTTHLSSLYYIIVNLFYFNLL
jgi:hypothetical protein